MSAQADVLVLMSSGCCMHVEECGVRVDTREEEIFIGSNESSRVQQYLVRLQTGAPAYKAGEEHGLPESAVTSILDELRECDLLLEVEASHFARSGNSLVEAFRSEARFRAKAIFEQGFWTSVLSGRASKSQILGWGVEFFHFVDAANIYMPIGVAHAREPRSARPAIARHYVEEMDHGEIFLDGLKRSGLDITSILAAPPLPQTAALINHLTEVAYEGGPAYMACFALMQPGLAAGTKEELARFYGALSGYYPYAAPMFDAFHRHASLDITLDHGDPPFFALCREEPGLSLGARRRVSTVMQALSESFILFFEGIEEWYGDNAVFALRRPFHLEAVL